MNRSNNERFQATENKIIDAFIRLLSEKPLPEITVSELCRACGIHRTSFYLHFQDVYDLSLIDNLFVQMGVRFISLAENVDSYLNPDSVSIGVNHMKSALQQRTNTRITSANAAVEKLAAEFGAAYLDLNAGITDEAGNLKVEYTIEGMHMYGDGYKPVLDALLPYLPKE